MTKEEIQNERKTERKEREKGKREKTIKPTK
jgi:hypothetical protein